MKFLPERLGTAYRGGQGQWSWAMHRITYNTDLMEAFELGFLLDLAQRLEHAARARTESRGGHSREDYPTRDDVNWLKHSLAWKTNGTIKLSYKPVTLTRYEPVERKY